MNIQKMKARITALSLIVTMVLTSIGSIETFAQPRADERSMTQQNKYIETSQPKSVKDLKIPTYKGKTYVVVNRNKPFFNKKDLKKSTYEKYTDLDSKHRVGTANAVLGKATMPRKGEKRKSISNIFPSGWKQERYSFIPGQYLYNRSHLIGWQLSAENANKRNLMTGTKSFNVSGMLPFENMVADYIQSTDDKVRYRVTPIFKGKEKLARGVYIEAMSIGDGGESVEFNVFIFNKQPGVQLDYRTGNSKSDGKVEGHKLSKKKKTIKAERKKKRKEKTIADRPKKKTKKKGKQSKSANIKVEIRGNVTSKIYHVPGQSWYERMAHSDNLIIFRSEKAAIAAGYRKAMR